MSYLRSLDEIGAGIIGRAVTDTLYVTPNGTGTDGKTWVTAYTTIQAALDAASTDADDCTLINIAPHTSQYDIYTTGDPTWSGNYILKGTHRLWAPIKNTHGSATSVMKFTGKASLMDLAIFQQGTVNGVIFTKSGFRIRHCGFNSEGLTGAATSIYIDGSDAITRGGIIDDIQVLGNVTYTKGLYINQSKINEFHNMHMHKCLTALHIVDADSIYNIFQNLVIGDCALGIDIDTGDDQHFNGVTFHDNTKNIFDIIGNSVWTNIHGEFDITIEPDDFTGVTVATHVDGGKWGTDTEIRAAATSPEKPFKIVAVVVEADAAEKFRLRLSADSGDTHFDDLFTEGELNAIKREASVASDATDHIFNRGTKISGSSKSESGDNSVVVWLKIQEI